MHLHPKPGEGFSQGLPGIREELIHPSGAIFHVLAEETLYISSLDKQPAICLSSPDAAQPLLIAP